MRAAVALFIASVLAGCGDAFFAHCGPSDTLEWTDPALFHALPDDHAGPLEGGLGAGDVLGFPGSRIDRVQWAPSGYERFNARTELDAQNVGVSASSDDEARTVLRAFLANISAADDAIRDAMLEDALANRTEEIGTVENGTLVTLVWHYGTNARGQWRVDELAARHLDNATVASAGGGSARVEAEGYAFVLRVPTREIDIDGIVLRVDITGRASASAPERDDGTSSQESIDLIVSGLRERGLPEPPETPKVYTTIC